MFNKRPDNSSIGTGKKSSNPDTMTNTEILQAIEIMMDHSLAEALAQNGIDATGLPTWIPRDYSIYSITSKVSDGIVKCVAEFESNRGDLMMRVTSYAMENTIAVEERDESSRCYSKGNVDYYIISNNDQVKISWQIGLNAYVIGGQISENEAKEIIDSIT